MNQRWLSLPLHPFLFALLPLATQLAFHRDQLLPGQAVRAVVVVTAATAVALVVLRFALQDVYFAALLLSTVSVLFFAYGHLFTLLIVAIESLARLVEINVEGSAIVMVAHLALLLGLPAFLLLIAMLLRRKQSWWMPGGVFLNAVGAAALLISLTQILSYQWQIQRAARPGSLPRQLAELPELELAESVPPDIYYLVMDGYTRKDVLSDGYGLDNSEFLRDLQAMGFWVADESRSNYSQTILSVSSSLNMAYVHDTPLEPDSEVMTGQTLGALAPLVRQSRVRQLLEQHDYQIVAYSSGYGLIEIVNADLYLEPDYQGINTFESLIIRTSALTILEEAADRLDLPFPYSGYGAHRERVAFALETLPQVAQMEGPKFVYLHLVLPHPPFVFDREGNPLEPGYRYTLADANDSTLTEQDYVAGYREQVLFLNERLRELLPQVIESSEAPVVILLQGDHGPGARLDWSNPSTRAIEERMAILSAYRMPEHPERALYPSISPVNSFRLLFNAYFGAEFELLPDLSYFSATNDPFAFQRLE